MRWLMLLIVLIGVCIVEAREYNLFFDRIPVVFKGAKPEIVKALKQNTHILQKYDINNPRRMRHFMCQIAHESSYFETLREYGNRAYFTRMYDIKGSRPKKARELGNIFPGDGARYKGRGLIQLTGRSNYKSSGNRIGQPLESNPELAAHPVIAIELAADYWKTRGLNELADKNDIIAITKKINGGTRGLKDRMRCYNLFNV